MMTPLTKTSWPGNAGSDHTRRRRATMVVLVLALAIAFHVGRVEGGSSERKQAQQILDASGVKGGLIAHISLGKTHFRLFAASRKPLSIEKPAEKSAQKSTGKKKQRHRAPAKSTVKYHWSQQVPLVVRAMFLAETTLFLAGTPVSARPSLDGPDFSSDRTDALAAFEASSPNAKESIWGPQANKGAVLYVVSTADGRKLAEYKLDSPPVFDGMAAANGRLYLVSNDGKILCFGANQ